MVTGQAKLLPVTGLPACGRKKQVISYQTSVSQMSRHVCSKPSSDSSDTDLLFHHFLCRSFVRLGDCWKLWHTQFFFYKICTAGGKNNESIISPMMAFLAGTPKKQSNWQLLVAWWLLSLFIFPGAHDTFQTFPWHDRQGKVVPFFIRNQYF